MTLLASWVAVDPRGIQSMYMASDSAYHGKVCIRIVLRSAFCITKNYTHAKNVRKCLAFAEMLHFVQMF